MVTCVYGTEETCLILTNDVTHEVVSIFNPLNCVYIIEGQALEVISSSVGIDCRLRPSALGSIPGWCKFSTTRKWMKIPRRWGLCPPGDLKRYLKIISAQTSRHVLSDGGD